MNSNSKGFTFLEIIVALGIMAVGFLAMSQMQYLSFRQKVLAESGTFSTNMIGTVSAFEMANAKTVNLLNAQEYILIPRLAKLSIIRLITVTEVTMQYAKHAHAILLKYLFLMVLIY